MAQCYHQPIFLDLIFILNVSSTLNKSCLVLLYQKCKARKHSNVWKQVEMQSRLFVLLHQHCQVSERFDDTYISVLSSFAKG